MTDGQPTGDDRDPAAGDDADRYAPLLSDYVDGTLSADQRAEVDAALARDPALRAELDALRATVGALKRLDRNPAPDELGPSVEDTINRRSAGRFFGRRTLGDRVPFGVLLIAALLLLVAVAALLWSSSTGSLRLDRKDTPPPPPGARDVVPHP